MYLQTVSEWDRLRIKPSWAEWMNEKLYMAHKNFHTKPCVFTAPDNTVHTCKLSKLKLSKVVTISSNIYIGGCTSGGVYVPCIYPHARWECKELIAGRSKAIANNNNKTKQTKQGHEYWLVATKAVRGCIWNHSVRFQKPRFPECLLWFFLQKTAGARDGPRPIGTEEEEEENCFKVLLWFYVKFRKRASWVLTMSNRTSKMLWCHRTPVAYSCSLVLGIKQRCNTHVDQIAGNTEEKN